MYFMCEYLFNSSNEYISFWDRVLRIGPTNLRGMILIEAENEDQAEEKFLAFFKKEKPNCRLRAWQIMDTVV